MRFVAAIAGIAVALPALLFFWIGSQTFVKAGEQRLAVILTIETGALLLLSIAALVMPGAARLQMWLLGVTILSLAIVLLVSRG